MFLLGWVRRRSVRSPSLPQLNRADAGGKREKAPDQG
jgi:hypothetical protein